ncbi:MAG: hypothetical protein V2J24_17790 [Pseudomonadales bacterium]|jgi:hypothetical protein|nr:hypothetical protein [Pseudomonadales bacterium]
MSAAGTWNITTKSPMGSQDGTLTLEVDGDSLTGKMSGAQGDIALEEGKVDGDSVSWVANLTQPMPIKIEAEGKVDGDAISGSMKLGAFGTATFEGSRA